MTSPVCDLTGYFGELASRVPECPGERDRYRRDDGGTFQFFRINYAERYDYEPHFHDISGRHLL